MDIPRTEPVGSRLPLHTRLIGTLFITALLLLAYAGNAASQGTSRPVSRAALPAQLAPEQVEAFVAPLSDQQARALLITTLREQSNVAADASADTTFAAVLKTVRELLTRVGARTVALVDAYERLPDTVERMVLLLTDLEGIEALGPGLWGLAAMLLAGAVGAALFVYFSNVVLVRMAPGDAAGMFMKTGYLAARLLRDSVAVAAFFVCGAALSFALFESVNPMRLFAITYLSVAAAVYLAWVVARFVFAPRASAQRLWPMADHTARRNTSYLVFAVVIIAFGFFSSGFMEIIGADRATLALLRLANVAVFALLLLVYVATSPGPAADTPAGFVHWRSMSLAFLFIMTALWCFNVVLGLREAAWAAFASMLIVLAMPAADLLLRRGTSDETSSTYTRTLRISVALFLGTLAVALLIEVGGGQLVEWFATPVGAIVGAAVLKTLLAVLVASIVWGIARAVIDNASERERVKAEAAAAEEGEGDGEGGSMIVGTRALTLLPLLRGTVFTLIVAITLMFALSSIGINIGPLLAGAGVIGLAVGFGAQALVRDIVAGVFFLIDDAFRIGEYIEIEELRGEVEKISIRSMQLRHHRGPIQTVPFGEIKSITNYNRDWVIYKQEFRLPYDVDTEKVRKLIKKLGQQMLANPEYGHHFIEPLKSQGVRRIEDSAVIIGTKFMCKPRKQFVLRRHVFQNIQQLFRDNGIEFATRRVIVESSGGNPTHDEAAGAQATAQAATPGAPAA